MKIINMPRGTGKTYNLVQLAMQYNGVVIVRTKSDKDYILSLVVKEICKNNKWDKNKYPFDVFTISEWQNLNNGNSALVDIHRNKRDLYIDDFPQILEYLLEASPKFVTYSSEQTDISNLSLLKEMVDPPYFLCNDGDILGKKGK